MKKRSRHSPGRRSPHTTQRPRQIWDRVCKCWKTSFYKVQGEKVCRYGRNVRSRMRLFRYRIAPQLKVAKASFITRSQLKLYTGIRLSLDGLDLYNVLEFRVLDGILPDADGKSEVDYFGRMRTELLLPIYFCSSSCQPWGIRARPPTFSWGFFPPSFSLHLTYLTIWEITNTLTSWYIFLPS